MHCFYPVSYKAREDKCRLEYFLLMLKYIQAIITSCAFKCHTEQKCSCSLITTDQHSQIHVYYIPGTDLSSLHTLSYLIIPNSSLPLTYGRLPERLCYLPQVDSFKLIRVVFTPRQSGFSAAILLYPLCCTHFCSSQLPILMKWNSNKDNMKCLTVHTGLSNTNTCNLETATFLIHLLLVFQVIPVRSQDIEM